MKNIEIKHMITAQQSQDIIIEALRNKKPLAVGKLGANECNTIYNHINKIPVHIPDLQTVAGVFPFTEETLNIFSQTYLEDLNSVDVLLSWAQQWGENQVLDYINYSNNRTDSFRGIEPFFIKDNWTNHLSGKKVLVISSHVKSIEHQYSNLSKIWNGQLFSNQFELYVLKSPLQPQFEQYHSSWFETLNWLKQSIRDVDFDILIVGAGAYGLPLAVEAKRLGKIGIHMGGSVQILFGLKGRRWDQSEEFQSIYNSYWIRPLDADTPKECHMVEDGCYW